MTSQKRYLVQKVLVGLLVLISQRAYSQEVETYIKVYQYNATFQDSTLVFEKWEYKNQPALKKGHFPYGMPVESEFVNLEMLSFKAPKKVYETFNPMVCEVGGQSAWNKYTVQYNTQKRPVLVKHWKAYQDDYDKEGNAITHKKPRYFLAEETKLVYEGGKTTQITCDASGKELERIIKQINKESKPVLEVWTAWDELRFKIFYTYQ